jgi:hypothetical protein
VKINFTSLGCVPAADLARNEEYAWRLGFPKMEPAATPRLAVVGGGPSVADHADELSSWDGEIWAINGAFNWCLRHGIDAAFFTIDPQPQTAAHGRGAARAVLATWCHPNTFDALADAEISAVRPSMHGATSATAAPALATGAGYREVTFYGCESSFGESTHVYGNRGIGSLMKVSCNGQEFLTTPDMMMQAEFLGELIRSAPCFRECSGGLLAAFIASPEIDVIAATQRIHDAMGAV